MGSKEKIGKCPFHTNFPAFCPISQTNQGNAPVLKLNFLKIEFQFKTRFLDNRVIANRKILKKKIFGTQVLCKVLEFYVKYSSSLKKFKWNSISMNSSTSHGTRVSKKKKKKISKSTFAITRCSKNRVLYLKLDFQKIEFQNKGISLISQGKGAKCWKVCVKGAFAYFGLGSNGYMMLSSPQF